jgi:hypothetical protein
MRQQSNLLRAVALVACGGAAWWSGGLVAPAGAAEQSAVAADLDASLAEAGSSSRESRLRAMQAIPLDRMPHTHRGTAEACLRATTLFRRLPLETVTCDGDLLDFVLTKPETLVDVWRVLGISRLSLDPAGPGQWRLADGYGTVGSVKLLHRERTADGGLLVFHGRGGYTGPLSPRRLTGQCLVVVRHSNLEPDAAGRERQAVQIDAFLDVDGLGLEIVTRALHPLIVHSAASNLREICLFVSQFSAAAARNPAGIARLTARMPRTEPEDRQALARLAAGSRGTPPVGEPSSSGEGLETELAARWMPADQLDRLQR